MSDPDANNSQTLWGGRFSEPTDAFVQRFTASESFDRRLAAYDIAGSKAHADMLMATGVITAEENAAIQQGLSDVLGEIEHGEFVWRVEREDVHMNIEARLTERMVIERYSHVMHMVSNVSATVREDVGPMEALRAALPAGTLSGAPKVRAMEIIDELESTKRGVYGGAVGYISWSGEMDTAIAIRTAVVCDGAVNIQAGAGIVADSVPTLEWEETLNKARAMLRAISMCQ